MAPKESGIQKQTFLPLLGGKASIKGEYESITGRKPALKTVSGIQ
jgi:hypothetical protein